MALMGAAADCVEASLLQSPMLCCIHDREDFGWRQSRLEIKRSRDIVVSSVVS